MTDRETSRIRGKLFRYRPDVELEGYVARRIEDEYGHEYDITLPMVRFAPPPPSALPHTPVTARTLEQRRMAAAALADAVRLARIIPRFELPRVWVRAAQFEARSSQ